MAANIINKCASLCNVDTFMHSLIIYNMFKYDVKHITFSLNSTAASWCNLPAYLGKQYSHVDIQPYLIIINQSMTDGVFPVTLKQQLSYRYTNLVKTTI